LNSKLIATIVCFTPVKLFFWLRQLHLAAPAAPEAFPLSLRRHYGFDVGKTLVAIDSELSLLFAL